MISLTSFKIHRSSVFDAQPLVLELYYFFISGIILCVICNSLVYQICWTLAIEQVNRELMDVIESLQRRTELEEGAEDTSEGTVGMDEKPNPTVFDKEVCDGRRKILEVSDETDGMNEKPNAGILETGNESSGTQDDLKKDASDPLVEAKQEKGNKQNKTSPIKCTDGLTAIAEVKSDTSNADAEVNNAIKGEIPKNNELLTNPLDSTPKRSNKRKKPNGESNSTPSMLSSGVKTRSMRAKITVAQNDMPSRTLQYQGHDDCE